MEDIKLKLSFRRGEGMKRMLLFVLLMLSVAWVFADTIPVGTGTDLVSGAPIDFREASGWSRTIYLGSELNFTNGTEITSIQYSIDTSFNAFVAMNYEIYLRQTGQSAYETTDDAPSVNPKDDGYTHVVTINTNSFSGVPGMLQTFTTPFSWVDGAGSNLEVLWVVVNAFTVANDPTQFYSTTGLSDYRTSHKWAGDDGIKIKKHIPNMTITFTPPPPPPSPAAINKLSPAKGADIFTNSVTFKWEISANDGDIMPTGYKLYYAQGTTATNLPVTPNHVINNGNTTQYTVAGLTHNSGNYVWKLVPYNAGGDYQCADDDIVWGFTLGTKDDTWTGTFDTDRDIWRQYTGLYDANLGSGEQWGNAKWLNQNEPTNGQAAVMKFGEAGRIGWLVSPVLKAFDDLDSTKEYALKFDIGLTQSGSSSAISNPNGQSGYRVVVYMSEYPNMGGAMHRTVIGEYNNTNSTLKFNEIPHMGTTITIPLGEKGYRYIGFYAEAGFSQGSVDLFIDNVKIQEVIATPEINIPQNILDFGYLDNGEKGTLNITVENSGGGTLALISSDFVFTTTTSFSVASNLSISLGAGESTIVPISAQSTQTGPISATLTVGGDTPAINKTVELSATILAAPAAGEVMLGRGSKDYGLPLNTEYMYNYSQTIVKNDEIGLKYKKITGLSFEWEGSNQANKSIMFSVCLQGTDKDIFTSRSDWISTNGHTPAAVSLVTVPQIGGRGWINIPFTNNNSYVPTGYNNFVVTVKTDAYSEDPIIGHFLSTDTDTYRSIRAWHDTVPIVHTNTPTSGDNFERLYAMPNMKFKLEKTVHIIAGEPGDNMTEHGVNAFFSMTGDGAADIVAEGDVTFEPYPNEEVTSENSFKFGLRIYDGSNRIITIKNSGYSFASYYYEGNWTAISSSAKDSGDLVLDIPGTCGSAGEVYPMILSNSNPTLPVELSHFSVTLNKENDAVIRWTTQSETGVNGFYIYRNTRDKFDNAELISSLIPATNSSNETQYSFTDKELYETGTYYYWLLVLDINGSENLTGPLTLQYNLEDGPEGVVPVVTTIKSIYPNPFNPSTTIAYSLKDKEDVSIHIYNTRGQLVYSVDRGTQDVGHYEYIWNGTSTNGTKVSSGMYFIRLKAGKTIVNKKAMLMK